MYGKLSVKITCLVIAIGLLGTVSTLNLMKNSIVTTFAQSMTTAANNTQEPVVATILWLNTSILAIYVLVESYAYAIDS